MSWEKKLTATEKAQNIFLNMVIEDIMDKIKFPVPRGAYSYSEKPTWYE